METEIVASRRKTALMLLGSLAFVAIGLFIPNRGDHSLRWATAFFSLCALVFLALLVRPQRLLLDQEGFTPAGGLARLSTKILWRDVSEFFVLNIRPGVSMIAFNYSPDAKNKPRATAFSRRFAGADGALSGTWSGSNAAIVQKLNLYRANALATTKA